MKRFPSKLILGTVLLCLLVGGCERKLSPPPLLSLSEADQKLIDIAKNELEIDIVLKRLEHTLWIYVPKEDFFRLKADKDGPVKSTERKSTVGVKYMDGKFEDRKFVIDYDIGPVDGYASSSGYNVSYPENFQEQYSLLTQAVYRVYAELKDSVKEDIPKAVDLPEFIVIVIADVSAGIRYQTMMAMEDVLRMMQDYGFYEESSRRVINEQPVGDANLIGDKEGALLQIYDVTWEEFLTRQIVNRIRFKFERSTQKPSDDIKKEILNAAADTVSAYNFQDFDGILLNDLSQPLGGEFPSVSPEELSAYQSAEKPQGRIVEIKFR